MIHIDAFTKDPDIGKKLLIGSLLALTVIGGLAVVGWMMEIIRRMQQGHQTLPDFDDIGSYFIDGLKVAGIALLWSLPVILLVVALALLSIFAPPYFADEQAAVMLVLVLNLAVAGLVMMYIFPMLLLMAPAIGILAETGSFKEAASVRNALRILRANPGGFVIAVLLGMVANSLLGSIGTVLCLVGIYPALVISYAILGQLYGAAYRDAKRALKQGIG